MGAIKNQTVGRPENKANGVCEMSIGQPCILQVRRDSCLCVHEVYTKVYTLLEINKVCFATCAFEKFAVMVNTFMHHFTQQTIPIASYVYG